MIAICKEFSLPWRSSSKKNTADVSKSQGFQAWKSHILQTLVEVRSSERQARHEGIIGYLVKGTLVRWSCIWKSWINLMLMLRILDLFKEFTVSRCFEPCHTVWNMFCTFSKLLKHPRTFRHIIKCSVIAGLPNNILNSKQHSTVIWITWTF